MSHLTVSCSLYVSIPLFSFIFRCVSSCWLVFLNTLFFLKYLPYHFPPPILTISGFSPWFPNSTDARTSHCKMKAWPHRRGLKVFCGQKPALISFPAYPRLIINVLLIYVYIKKRQCLQWGQALPTAMATTVSSSVSTGSSDLSSLSQNINNAADISVIVIYFVVVLAVGIWVCESPVRFLGGHKNCRGKHLML